MSSQWDDSELLERGWERITEIKRNSGAHRALLWLGYGAKDWKKRIQRGWHIKFNPPLKEDRYITPLSHGKVSVLKIRPEIASEYLELYCFDLHYPKGNFLETICVYVMKYSTNYDRERGKIMDILCWGSLPNRHENIKKIPEMLRYANDDTLTYYDEKDLIKLDKDVF